MSIIMGRRLRGCLVAVVLGVLIGALPGVVAAQQNIPLSAFFGGWVGSGISQTEESVAFQYTHRDINVTIAPVNTGFSVSWTTVQRQRGNPNDPTPVRKTTTTTFVPAGRPNVWRATGASDPITGNPYSWARLEGPSLVIYALEVNPAGRPEMQIYRRTLSGLGMQLEFARVVEGDVSRTVKGQLTKFAN